MLLITFYQSGSLALIMKSNMHAEALYADVDAIAVLFTADLVLVLVTALTTQLYQINP